MSKVTIELDTTDATDIAILRVLMCSWQAPPVPAQVEQVKAEAKLELAQEVIAAGGALPSAIEDAVGIKRPRGRRAAATEAPEPAAAGKQLDLEKDTALAELKDEPIKVPKEPLNDDLPDILQPTKPKLTLEYMQQACQQVYETQGATVLSRVLVVHFNVKRWRDVPEDKWPELLEKLGVGYGT